MKYRKKFIPSRTSPKGGKRACLCKDRNTYSISCCKGGIMNQGLGPLSGNGISNIIRPEDPVIPVDTPFISTWATTAPNEVIELPYEVTGTYNGMIDWGDGTITDNSYTGRSHTYAVADTYTIRISGQTEGWRMDFGPQRGKIKNISQWGTQFRVGNNANYFYGCGALDITATDILNLEGTTDFTNMFRSCNLLVFNDSINEWDVSNVENMQTVFHSCINFNQPLNNWVTSAATNMATMFFGTNKFNQDLSSWDTSNVTRMDTMFRNALAFNQDISAWDTSSVTNMASMFRNADDFDQDISAWDYSNVTNITFFMRDKTAVQYTPANYDALLIRWNTNAGNNLVVDMGGIQYTSAGQAARTNLINVKGWTIVDGGLQP